MAQILKLQDGRDLQYSTQGAAQGFPLIWIHGTPGAYPAIPQLIAACKKKNIKLITFSRAGYGQSSRHEGRAIVDEVADVQSLMQHLAIKECFIGGWSGGGPPALACAARLTGCKAVVVVAGVAPYDIADYDWLAGQGQDNVEEFNEAMKGSAATTKYCEASRLEILKSDAKGIAEGLESLLPEADKKAMANVDGFGDFMVRTFHGAMEQSASGWIDDDLAIIKPWGFSLDEIRVPVFQYQGTDDLMVPFQHGEWIAKNLPKQYGTSHLEKGEGHISIFFGREDGMLDELLGALSM